LLRHNPADITKKSLSAQSNFNEHLAKERGEVDGRRAEQLKIFTPYLFKEGFCNNKINNWRKGPLRILSFLRLSAVLFALQKAMSSEPLAANKPLYSVQTSTLSISTTMKLSLLFLSLFSVATAVELTPDNWDAETAGKTVLIKFLAPW